jgi:hypothetical protein
MIVLEFLIALALSECEEVEGGTFAERGCLYFADLPFTELSETAIVLERVESISALERLTFTKCTSTTNAGAISILDSSCWIQTICASECHSTQMGQFASITGESLILSQVTAFECGSVYSESPHGPTTLYLSAGSADPSLEVTYLNCTSCYVTDGGVICVHNPPEGSVLQYWSLLSWQGSEALFLSGGSGKIQDSNFISEHTDAVFRFAIGDPMQPWGLFTIANCYIGADSAEFLVFGEGESSGVSVLDCFFSGQIPAMLNDDTRFSGSDRNIGNCPVGHDLTHAAWSSCELMQDGPNLLGTAIACETVRMAKDNEPCVTIVGCFFLELSGGDDGGAIYLSQLTGRSLLGRLTFIACKSDGFGGAVCVRTCAVNMQQLCGAECECPSGAFASFDGDSSTLSQLTAVGCAATTGTFICVAGDFQAIYLNFTLCSAASASALSVTRTAQASQAQSMTVSELTGDACIDTFPELAIDTCLFQSTTTYAFHADTGLTLRYCYFDTAQPISVSGSVSIANSFFINDLPEEFDQNQNCGNCVGRLPEFHPGTAIPCEMRTASNAFNVSAVPGASQGPVGSEVAGASEPLVRSAAFFPASNPLEASNNLDPSNDLEASNHFEASTILRPSEIPGASKEVPVGSAPLSGSQPPSGFALPPNTAGFTTWLRVYQVRRRLRQGFMFLWITAQF